MVRLSLLVAMTLCLFSSATAKAADTPARPPNVVIFLSDDLGWGELGFQGNQQIPTPHHDSIAANGVRFTQGYVAATYCSPSRAGLLTGRYPTRFGHEFNPGGNRATAGLPLSEKTIAERMKSAGYQTICVGKWHLGEDPKFYPTARGFDEFYGTLANTPFIKPKLFMDTRKAKEVVEVTDPNFYTTDAYAERACDFIDRNKDKPFLLYLPFNAQHAPLEAPQKYMERVKALKIEDPKRQLFAGMMLAMDDAIGRVLGKLRETGLEQNTLVWYLADNGGPTQGTTSSNGVLRGFKMTTNEGGTRVPIVVQWKGRLPAGKVYDQPVIQLDILPTVFAAIGKPLDVQSEKLDGVDLLPYLSGENAARPHQTLYWRFGEQWAVRDGDWKLVASRVDGNTPRLINLAEDAAEAKDLSAAHPDKVKALKAKWDTWSGQQAPPAWGRENPRRNQRRSPAAQVP